MIRNAELYNRMETSDNRDVDPSRMVRDIYNAARELNRLDGEEVTMNGTKYRGSVSDISQGREFHDDGGSAFPTDITVVVASMHDMRRRDIGKQAVVRGITYHIERIDFSGGDNTYTLTSPSQS